MQIGLKLLFFLDNFIILRYCQCFAAKFICTSSCRCVACENVSKSSKLRKEAVQSMLERNPAAFDSKYKPSLPNPTALGPVTAHKIGCKCRRSRCLKKYCECFEGAVPCSSICSCVDCCNPANPQLGRGTKPTAAAVKYNTDNVSQFEQFKSVSVRGKFLVVIYIYVFFLSDISPKEGSSVGRFAGHGLQHRR